MKQPFADKNSIANKSGEVDPCSLKTPNLVNTTGYTFPHQTKEETKIIYFEERLGDNLKNKPMAV